jgi:membrane protease YdiL (CAAX protease family)
MSIWINKGRGLLSFLDLSNPKNRSLIVFMPIIYALFVFSIDSLLNLRYYDLFSLSKNPIELHFKSKFTSFTLIFQPIIEEIIFRGFYFWFMGKKNLTFHVLFSSLLFLSIHYPFNPTRVIFLYMLGVILCLISLKWNFLASSLVHIIYNIFINFFMAFQVVISIFIFQPLRNQIFVYFFFTILLLISSFCLRKYVFLYKKYW